MPMMTCIRRRGLPEWQAVPGMRIVVDCFGRGAEKASGCRAWILTHFHSDHYRGLTARFSAGALCPSRLPCTSREGAEGAGWMQHITLPTWTLHVTGAA